MLALLAGCGSDDGGSNEPIPIEPQLDFVSVNFVDGDETSLDTIALTIRYRDGDGDIGLTSTDQDVPYQPYNFFLENGTTLTPVPGVRINIPLESGNSSTALWIKPGTTAGKLVTLETREKPAFSNLPQMVYPYSCLNYRAGDVAVAAADKQILDDSHVITDTVVISNQEFYILPAIKNSVYSERNENSLNLYVDLLQEESNGTYSTFDFTRDLPTKICSPGLDAQLPLLSAFAVGHHAYFAFNFDINSMNEGQITYFIVSAAFHDLFANKNVKLRVSLKDRALHESNTIETSVFRIQ